MLLSRLRLRTPGWPKSPLSPAQQTPELLQIRAQHKTAIVTGSARGIGKAIAIRLAEDGYDVTVNDIPHNQAQAEEVVSQIKNLGRKSTLVVGDVSKRADVKQVIETSVKELGPLDTMVANAGIAQVKPLLKLTDDDFRRMFEVNVYGVFNCYIEAAKQMIEQGGGGKLIGAASIVAFKPFAMLSHYSASKWAVRGLTQAMAMEMAAHKITVNAYAPGIVGTAMWDLIDEELGKTTGAKKGDTIKKYTKELIALGRTSVPEDVSKTVGFLAGPDSEYMTGQTIVVDGGIIYT
ncbi:putative acetoin dehydrogenase (diacetyl reductase) protein [Neofusicoccum parvum UCRNP2]|uniref:Putative acetoin dehydrogenase (Diacetyl reductase) protein n=1 Tax=Botryosphaeria parva (strain UCR-NP2) TaxID=1287680 RepID=R1GM35_BOTPV|nr:putative acetoin dehydrogenase (diacetyl reductase) protein [Neofusicoccum parvum UCRNP2]